MKTLKDYIIESVLFDIGIELNETNGAFDDTSAVSVFISNKIYELYNKSIYDKQFVVNRNEILRGDVIFDSITIKYYIDDNINKCIAKFSYINDKDVDIFIVCPNNFSVIELRKVIAHEYHHFSQNLILIGKGLRDFDDIFNKDEKYRELYNTARNFNDRFQPLEVRKLRNALYILDKFELNAFISQLCEEVNILKEKRQLDKSITPNEIYNIIKDTDIYKAYINLGIFIDEYKTNNLSQEEINNIISEWNNLQKTNIRNPNKIFKQLENRLKRSFKHINEVIPKKIIETLKSNFLGEIL